MKNSFLSMGLIEMNIIQARQAILYFKTNNLKYIKNSAAYELQQACEKLIKIQIYCSCLNINNFSMYTHNLTKLVLYADSLGIVLDIPSYIRSNMDKITDWEAGSRYNIGFSIRIDTLDRCYNEVLVWYNDLHKKGYR